MAIRPENQDARDKILSILRRVDTNYKTVFVQAAFARRGSNTWKNCLTKIIALDAEGIKASSLMYDNFSYVEDYITPKSLSSLVDSLVEKGTLGVSSYTVRLIEESKLPDTILFRESQYLSTQNSFVDVEWDIKEKFNRIKVGMESVRKAIPERALEEEQERQKHGSRQSLI